TGVAAGPQLVGSGVTDGTPGGTHVVETYYSTDVAPGGVCPGSNIQLVQTAGSTTLNKGLCIAEESSLHITGGGGHVDTGGIFSFSVDALGGATEIQIKNTTTGDVLYSSLKQATAPDITGVSFDKTFDDVTVTAPTIPP